MKLQKRLLSLMLIFVMIAGISLSGHAIWTGGLKGSVTSYGDTSLETTMWLYEDGNTVPIWKNSVARNQFNYEVIGIDNGNYTLSIEKAGHVTRNYNITIDNSEVTLDAKICLQGDANCNGKINMGDVSTIYAHSKGSSSIKDPYQLACADTSGDGKINLGDTSRVYAMSKGSYKPSPKKVTLSVWTPLLDQEGDNSWLQQMEAGFQKAHPEYQITWKNEVCHEGDAGWMVANDPENAADVYMFANDQLGALVEAGALQELSGKYILQVKTDNSETMVNTVTYTDENIYGFPMTNNTWFMYYNKDIFSEEDIKSLDTMLTKGRVAFPWENAWYSGTFFLAVGGTIFGDKGNDASAGIDFAGNKGGYDAALKMVELAANPNMVNDFAGSGVSGMYDGSVGAFFSGSWDYAGLYEQLGDKLGVTQLPTVEICDYPMQMKAFAGSKAVAANPYSTDPELAAAFAAYLATPEAQKLRYDHYGVIPAATSLVSDPDISENPVATAEINTIKNAAVVQPYIPEMSNYWTPVGNFSASVISGKINKTNYTDHFDQMVQELNPKNDYDYPENATVLTIWTSAEDQVEGGWLETIENAYAAAHPELNIIWNNEICAEGDAGWQVSYDPQNAADVYMFSNDQLSTLVDAGAIQKLTGSSLAQVLSDNSQTLINTVTYTDGGIYGFPVNNNTWFMYYNKDIFTEEDVKSLDTMLTKGRVAFSWGNGWYSGTFFLANGGTLFGDKGNDASAGIQFGKDNGGYEAALKMIQLANNPNFVTDSYGSGSAGMIEGSIDAFFSGSWDYEGLYEYLGDKLGTVQLPTVEINGVQKQMKSFAGSKAVAISPYSNHPDIASDFAAYLASVESQKLRYQLRGVIPATHSLANDPCIQHDQLALAEINTMSNAAVIQPYIPEMSNYWLPMGNYSTDVLSGEVNESNYQESVNQLMRSFGNIEQPNDSFQISNITTSVDGISGNITLRIHYHRPDRDYAGWNAWLWYRASQTSPEISAPFQFKQIGNEMVCAVEIPSGTNEVGYIIRLNDWDDKDVYYDQFIDLTGILQGTLDVYIEAGVPGYTMVLQDDVITGISLISLDYSLDSQQLIMELSSNPTGDFDVTLKNSDGSIAITTIKRVGKHYYLTIDQPLTHGRYTLTSKYISVTFDII